MLVTVLCVVLLFCASIIQGKGVDVSNKRGEVTQFPMTDSTTFLAHVSLDGKYFSQITVGDTILVLDDDPDSYVVYDVIEIVGGQASEPLSLTTNLFIDNQWMTPDQVWDRVGYVDPDKLILQTCIEKNGDKNWGRLFVIAEPWPKGDRWKKR